MYLPDTTWPRLALAVALVQGLLALGLEAYVFVTAENDIDPAAAKQTSSGRTVPMYLSLFILAYVYELVVVYDALRLNSMIQLVGICIYNFLLLSYAAAQPLQVQNTFDSLRGSYASMGERPLLPPELHTWERVRPALIAVIIVQAVATGILGFLTYKLHFEFAWVVYKVVQADLGMKRRLLDHQFDFFFLLGFLVQIVTLIVSPQKDPEFALSIAGIFVALAVMCLATYCAIFENRPGSIAIVVAYLGSVVYLIYKLFRLYNETNYMLIVFAGITLAMMICTIVMAVG
ncbi:hypothetical protein PG995_005184 [Apiospora arundinis]